MALTGGIDMAGLLDIFGTGGADTMGLLGMSQADIQSNRDDAQAQALYALAGRLFAGGNTGQSIAEGLQLGQKAYKSGMSEAMQSQLQNYQLQELMKKKKLEEQVKQLAPFTLKEQVTREAMPAQAALYGKPTDYPLLDDEGNVMPEASIIPARPAETALIPNQAVIGKLQELLPFKDFENLMQGIERRQKLGQPDYMTVDKTIFKKTIRKWLLMLIVILLLPNIVTEFLICTTQNLTIPTLWRVSMTTYILMVVVVLRQEKI